MPDPYAEFQQPAAASNPYAEFQQPAKAAPAAKPVAPPEPSAWSRFTATLPHPIDALSEFINRPNEMRKLSDAMGADADYQNFVGPHSPAQEQAHEAAMNRGMNATLPSADGNALTETMQPAVDAARQVKDGNLAGAAGTVVGAVAPMLLAHATGKVLAAPAAPLAEEALGVRKLDRAYSRTPGRAILDETNGFRPSTIADSAHERLGDINSQLESATNASQNQGSLDPARLVIQKAIDKAQNQNNGMAMKQLQPLMDQLSTNVVHGTPLSATQSPSGILSLKRGFGDAFVHNWNPETMQGVKSTAAQAYRKLDGELDRTVPEASDLNQRASSLIPVAKRAESTDLNANMLQKTLGRIARPTGALASGIGGAFEGGQHFGPLGAVTGGLIGLGLPELISSPTAQMIAARGLNVTGKGLQSAAPALPLIGKPQPQK